MNKFRETERGQRGYPCSGVKKSKEENEMNETIITLVCALMGSGAATAMVNGLFHSYGLRRQQQTGESQGMRWLLQDRLEQLALCYLSRGYVTMEQLRQWNRGHQIYHDLLGGNGDLNGLKDELRRLRIREEE